MISKARFGSSSSGISTEFKFIYQEILEALYKTDRKTLTLEELSKKIEANPECILDILESQVSNGNIEKSPREPVTYSITKNGQRLIRTL